MASQLPTLPGLALAMNQGDQMWMNRIITRKSRAELCEIVEELAAVERMYDQSYIDSEQLTKLQRVIITKTASTKPDVKTRSTRTVSELCVKYNRQTSTPTQPMKRIIKLGGNVSAKISRYELKGGAARLADATTLDV